MENIEKLVKELLNDDNGHGFDHVERVRELALGFTEQEGADRYVVELSVLLHDVDDYKLFGAENAEHLTNANRILSTSDVSDETKLAVLEIIGTMGYSKYLEGTRPVSLEGQIVSDADMCDAIGAQGILRTYSYNTSKGVVFFDKDAPPVDSGVDPQQYRSVKNAHAVQHFFDKMLVIPSILMTRSGREEGDKRLHVMVEFLGELFREERATEWSQYLERFLVRKV
ncbi:MAG: HD domain-containing protein [Candidatus Saccharimonas sp.]